MDLSFLDRPEILEVVFPLVYSSFQLPDYLQYPPPGIPCHDIEVEEGVRVRCGFWVAGKECSSIVYFHGNGETAATYDSVARLYNQRDMNLFVAEYRGYGGSDGRPTISNMLLDCHAILSGFDRIIAGEGFRKSVFLMGRSLGSIPAIELALHHHETIRGLIVESGTANTFRGLWNHLGINGQDEIFGEGSPFLNGTKIRQVRRPTLVIHGEYDQIIPVQEGEELYQNSGAEEKRLLLIPGAGHNDIMMLDQGLYFDTIAEFVAEHG